MLLDISNEEFVEAVFGADAPWCHVTDFPYDPLNIPPAKKLASWKGDYFSRYRMSPNTNQYFTISCFYADEQQKARRRKALFRHTPCIVLDDVKEKLSMEEVSKLPRPSWVLESSTGSEQWGYILNTPCADRGRVENLLDGLVANGLAPDGVDPGMKGVTRYVRLPGGINNKASKLVDGQPFQCRMLIWEPFTTVTIEQLAAPFEVDLDRVRREARVDGAADVSDHPLLNIPDTVIVKEVLSEGRFDITCPWVDEHTGMDDSGSAVFTNGDGTIGFKCHHGSCQGRSAADLLRFIENDAPGFGVKLKNWQVMREFSHIAPVAHTTAPVAPVAPDAVVEGKDALNILCNNLRKEVPGTPAQRDTAVMAMRLVDDLPKIEKLHWHGMITDIMRWSRSEFKEILRDLQLTWYSKKSHGADFYDNVVFVKSLNQFYDWNSNIFLTPDAFQNSYSSEDPDARKNALQGGRSMKADLLDYAPSKARMFTECGRQYANTWSGSSQSIGEPGDISRWIDHFAAVGWEKHREHVEKWMAFTLRYPERKINHMLLLGSGEGVGKDFLLYPLAAAMGDNYTSIDGTELLHDYQDYLLTTKYLNINETDFGSVKDTKHVSNRLKPLASTPPFKIRVNQKCIKHIKVRNIVNTTMTTNDSYAPLHLQGSSRRFYAMWSTLRVRDASDNMLKEWREYWTDRWNWMESGGWKAVAHYLIHDVDISDFNPGEAPPMTEFLRDIKEASKSSMLLDIERLTSKGQGVFLCDILTTEDIVEALRADVVMSSAAMSSVGNFTIKNVARAMRTSECYNDKKCSGATLWILRNRDKYMHLSGAEVHKVYEEQMALVRSGVDLLDGA